LAWLYVAQCVADGYRETGIVHVTLGTVNNCLEEHTSSTVIFHPGYQFPTAGSNAALIKLEYPSKHTPVQLYHTGTVGFESCDGSSRLLQVKPRNPTLSATLPLCFSMDADLSALDKGTHTCNARAAHMRNLATQEHAQNRHTTINLPTRPPARRRHRH